MGRKIEFFIDNDNGNVKIKDYLKHRGVSHRMLCVLKRTEFGILKNGVGARSIDILNSGDTLTLNLPSDEGTASAVPADIPLDIIYEDDDILVINKKPDIAMHESHNHRCDALSNAVAFHLMKEGKECVFRSVGRLDKGTSGIVVCALNKFSAAKLSGKIYKEYSLPGGYHHDYYEMPNGNLLVASDDFNSGEGTVEDYVVEVDRKTGQIVKHFDLKDILNMEDGKSENWIEYDWFHNNSVWYDEETNSITLSGRHQDAVINIDYDSGDLNWIIGDSTNWSEDYQKHFFKSVGETFEWQWSQHAAMITPEGYVFIFDNGNNKSKIKDEYVPADKSYSRGVMYKIDTDNMAIEQVFEYGKERGSDFYSPYISDVDYLESNHYIIHSGGIVYVDGRNSNQPAGISGADRLVSDTVEYKDDKVIFEIVLPTNNNRVE